MACLAANRATKEDLAKMKKILENMRKRIKSQSTFAECDFAFHFAIANAARNTILFETIAAIRELLKSIHNEVVELPGMAEISYQHHVEIYEGIKAGSCELAKKAMLNHISIVESRVKSLPFPNEE